MPHIAYIDSDEEIISVIGRLRKIAEPDVFFVVPKRAIFLQSLVNLRLLEREAKKCGKRLVLVSPDETARALAAKAGISSQEALENKAHSERLVPNATLPARLSLPNQPAPGGQTPPELPRAGSVPLHSESIGSSSFFTREETPVARSIPASPQKESAVHAPSPVSPSVKSLPVRDRTPQRLTVLNSMRDIPVRGTTPAPPPSAPPESVSRGTLPDSLNLDSGFASKETRGVPSPATPLSVSPESSLPVSDSSHQEKSGISFNFPVPEKMPSFTPIPSESAPPSVSAPGTPPSSLRQFYRGQSDTKAPLPEKSLKKDPVHASPRQKRVFFRVIFGFAFVSLLVAVGVSAFLLLPRADVTILVKGSEESIDAEIRALLGQEALSKSEKTIPLRLIESEKDLSASFPGTGKASSSDKRARGTVTLSNMLGASPQSLVATTRLESPDGKVFRLVKGVTIPGATEANGKMKPGTVIAEVVADQSGEAYNIEPASFTIPGLKGGPKYEKITAISEKAFSGGGGSEATIASISADDVSKAKESSEKKIAEMLRTELEKDLRPGEKLFEDALQWEVLSAGAFPGAGAVAPSFDYRIRVSARALVVSESDIRTVAAGLFDGENISADSIDIEYTVPRPDFVAKSLTVKARVSVQKNKTFDVESVKQKILGKTIPDVQGVFAEYPDIRKIEVVFWPKFMTSRIPSRADRVFVTVEQER